MISKKFIHTVIVLLALVACIMPLNILAAPGESDLAVCLPDQLADFKATNKMAMKAGDAGEKNISRIYANNEDQIEVTLWQLPTGNNVELPYFKGKKQWSMVIVGGRLCMLDNDKNDGKTTLVVQFDMGFITPPQYTYSVGIVANRADGENIVTTIAEALDHDKIFGLYKK